MKPRVGIVLGDPCGIGPELAAKLLADAENRDRADILVIGDHRILQEGAAVAGCSIDVASVNTFEDANFEDGVPVVLNNLPLDPETVRVGHTSQTTGQWQLDCLSAALRLASDGRIDGFCFAPLNKEAMHLGGLTHEDELGFFVEELGHRGPTGILNTLGDLWTSRVTSHVPHKAVSEIITRDTVVEAIRIADSGLRLAGYDAPRLAVAGLNPHAGDGGNFGQCLDAPVVCFHGDDRLGAGIQQGAGQSARSRADFNNVDAAQISCRAGDAAAQVEV